jgi:3-oxoacyl-(acyl-carrier-protein) synthase
VTDKRRVAITGLGLVTPAGNSASETWSTLLAGRSRISTVSRFDASGFPVRIAAEVRGFDEAAAVADRKLLKFANRSHLFALAAAEEAMRDAGIHPSQQTRRRWGCAVGTGMMGMEFADLIRLHRHSAAAGELDAHRLLDDEVAPIQ